jgi:hypothetical protein
VIGDPTRVCELLVGLGDVTVLGATDTVGEPVRIHIENRGPRPACPRCGWVVWVTDQRPVELVDLPVFGRAAMNARDVADVMSEEPTENFADAVVEAAQCLELQGVRAIMGNCGFFVGYQNEVKGHCCVEPQGRLSPASPAQDQRAKKHEQHQKVLLTATSWTAARVELAG